MPTDIMSRQRLQRLESTHILADRTGRQRRPGRQNAISNEQTATAGNEALGKKTKIS
jgi:hypothetical protein